MLDTAMERLSTGQKINSASDDAAGLAIVQRMTSQINGLAMAVKNANDGISMTQSIEGALVEVTDMLQRLRELAIQAANATNTDTDRAYIQEEVNLLIAEISRISSNTRYNGQHVLNGTFQNVQLQVGTEGGETINFNVDTVAADQLGAYVIKGDRIEANAGHGAGVLVNDTDPEDDIIINGSQKSSTIDVVDNDTAKAVAAKINAVTGDTGVTAKAQTYAHLYSEWAADKTYSVKINNKTTGYFAISSSNVADAVDKINAISGSTGVTAKGTTDNKVLLHSIDGSDILIENESSATTDTNLRVQTVGFDGDSVMPRKAWHRGVASTAGSNADMVADGTFTLVQRSTNQTWSFAVGEGNARTVADLEADLNGISGAGGGFKVLASSDLNISPWVTAREEFGDFDIYEGSDITDSTKLQTYQGYATRVTVDSDDASWNTGANGSALSYILRNLDTGVDYTFSVTKAAGGGPTAAEVLSGLNGIDGVGAFHSITASASAADHLIYGPADFGSWTILEADGTASDTTVVKAGDLNAGDTELAYGGQSNDSATVQGSIELRSSKAFSVTQANEVDPLMKNPDLAHGLLTNDNYLTTRAAKLNSVSNMDLRTTEKAGLAIGTIDGAIEKVSSMRAELGAIENRLNHTVSNLMNVAENTADSRSRINDADFSVESANLAKSQVLQQAGTAMLAQANARSQLVLQLLQ